MLIFKDFELLLENISATVMLGTGLGGTAMLTFLLHRQGDSDARIRQDFYRIDVTYNLFGEYSIMREWGRAGQRGRHVITWVSNLRDAMMLADGWQRKAYSRGFQLTERSQ
ncbi:WGR domain-containing protein [Roseovarius sp. MMSF_3281]|uniref:WGR domain-containing protein n=1 Tax=Roseovarius sp. MMSF_3281 TaxID=3046694 RepID=UPI00273E5683|nr:WGR domain-containing protein [Roseovarius sp. MMSF_3281]